MSAHSNHIEVWMELKDPAFLKMAMRSRGLSHRGLAHRVGLNNHGMIGHLVSGRRKSCSPELAAKICVVLGVPQDLLFLPRMSSGSGGTGKSHRNVAA